MRSEGIQIGKIYGIPIFLHGKLVPDFLDSSRSGSISDFDALHLNLFRTSRLVGLGVMTSLLFFAIARAA